MFDLRAKGVKFLHSVPNTGPLGRYVAFVDPFGTVFELMEESASSSELP
jgi:predicted enzyme related to lactoylglutathione lyase